MRRLTPKARGELAEMRFQVAAADKGLIVAKPWGDSLPFDFVVGSGGSRFYRVQVKSTTRFDHGRYFVSCSRNADGRRAYTAREIDFLAAYLVPEDAWFIIPVRVLGKTKMITIGLEPRRKGRCDKYRDAWHLLRQ